MPTERARRGAGGKRRPKPAAHADAGGEGEGMLELHRGRFVPWAPAPIVGLAAGRVHPAAGGEPGAAEPAREGGVLAVLRQCGAVEVWQQGSGTGLWHLARTLPGASGAAPTAAAWLAPPPGAAAAAGLRLLTAGLDGAVVEWDVKSLRPRLAADTAGAAVWGMAAVDGADAAARVRAALRAPLEAAGLAGGTFVATACDDGAVRVLAVDADRIAPVRKLGPADGRVLCVEWGRAGAALFCGDSRGMLRCYDVGSGREVWSTDAKADGQSPCIWSVKSLADGTVATGNSFGQVQLWDGEHGTLLQAFHNHRADVLALAVSEGEDAIFSAGADCQVSMFARLAGAAEGGGAAWSFVDKKRPHSHDVKALALTGGVLFSGGNDARLLSYAAPRFAKKHPTVLTTLPQRPHLELAKAVGGAPRLLCQQKECVDIWRIGETEAADIARGREGDFVVLREGPLHLARIAKKGAEHILVSSVSANGEYVCYSDVYETRLFRLSSSSETATPGISPVDLPLEVTSSCCICFAPDSSRLLLANHRAKVFVIDLATGKLAHAFPLASFLHNEDSLALSVSAIVASPCGKRAAIAVQSRAIVLVDLGTLATHGLCNSPAAITALAFSRSGKHLFVGTADALATSKKAGPFLLAFDVEKCEVEAEYADHCKVVSKRLKLLQGTITGFACNPAVESSLIAFTGQGLCHVDFSKATPEKRKKRRVQDEHRSFEYSLPGQNVRTLPLEDPCLHLSYLSDKAALIIECPWSKALDSVPEPIFKRAFAV